MTFNEFVCQSRIKYGDKFSYIDSSFTSFKKNVDVICPLHGKFTTTPNSHLFSKHGCPRCGRDNITSSQTNSWESFVNRSTTKFKNKYKYEQLCDGQFCAQNSTIKITCLDCNDSFDMLARNHLFSKSGGCKNCQYTKNGEMRYVSYETASHFLSKSFPDKKYIIDKNYNGLSYNCDVICPTHGKYITKPLNFQYGHGSCPNCKVPSNLERKIEDFLNSAQIIFSKNNRSIIKPNEIDFYIPDKMLGIETCGLYWHSEKTVPKDYHLEKLEKAEKFNINLIQIFEDELYEKADIVYSILHNKILKCDKIFARKCELQLINSKVGRDFLISNHLQGDCKSSIYIGLFFNDEIVSCMSFGSMRLCMGNKKSEKDEYELQRFCNKKYTNVVGGSSKLLKFFEQNFKPKKLTSYADRRYFGGSVYEKLGFNFISNTNPNYFYYKSGKGNRRYSRFQFRKSVLHKKLENFDPDKTEHENMLNNGYFRIYDCGNKKYTKIYE